MKIPTCVVKWVGFGTDEDTTDTVQWVDRLDRFID